MKRPLFLCIYLFLLLSACKSAYEKVRTSSDPLLIYKTANQYYQKKDFQKAVVLYESIITSYRGQKEAEEIYFKYAQCQYELSDFESASLYFKNFASTFVLSPLREEAEFMSVYSIYKTAPSFRLDQSNSEKAIDGFQIFVNSYPESKRVDECNKLIDELRARLEKKSFEQALLYFNLKSFQACLTTLENILSDFPETKNEKEIRLLAIKASHEWAVNSIFEKKKERLIQTLEKCDLFLRKFPTGKSSIEVKEIKRNINSTLKSIKS